MIYLFCSAFRPLYKRDALESICYPRGHLFRFRYERKYIDPRIIKSPKDFEGKEGIIIFLDTVGKARRKKFDFFPIRKIRTVRIFPLGLAIYIDFKFGDFVDYGPEDDDNRRTKWCSFFQNLSDRPWPPPKTSGRKDDEPEGYFMLFHPQNNPHFPVEGTAGQETWENLARRLDRTNDLKGSTFLQVLGFYKIKRRYILGSRSEDLIKSRDNSFDSFYPLPMGKSVVLKLLLSRPGYDSTIGEDRRVLKVKLGKESFAGVSKETIYFESRYNQERIVLVCKRVFDSVMSTIAIDQENEPSSVQSPKPFLLTRIEVPKYIVGIVVLGVVLATLLLGFDSELIKLVGSWILPAHKEFITENAKVLSAVAKSSAAIPIAVSAYLAFRRLPLK